MAFAVFVLLCGSMFGVFNAVFLYPLKSLLPITAFYKCKNLMPSFNIPEIVKVIFPSYIVIIPTLLFQTIFIHLPEFTEHL